MASCPIGKQKERKDWDCPREVEVQGRVSSPQGGFNSESVSNRATIIVTQSRMPDFIPSGSPKKEVSGLDGSRTGKTGRE